MRFLKSSNFLVFCIIFFLFGFFAVFFVDSYHDSFVLVPAIHLLEGKMLFRDSFTQYGALFTLIHTLGLKFFGVHVYSLRLTTLLFYAGTAVIVWSIYRRFLPRIWNVYALLLLITLSPIYKFYFLSWSSVPAAFFQCFSLLLVIWFIEQNKLKYIVAAGFFSMLAFWTRQPVGILNTLAINSAFIVLWFTNYFSFKKTLSVLFWFNLGNLLGFIPIYLWLFANNAISAWWQQSFEMQAVWAKIVKGTGPNQIVKSLVIGRYLKDWKNFPEYGIWIFIPITIFLTAFTKLQHLVVLKIKNKKTVLLFITSFVCLASWHQYYPAGDPNHYFWANIPSFGLFVYILYTALKHTKPHLLKYALLGLYLLTTLVFINRISSALYQLQTFNTVINKPTLISGIPANKNEKIFFETNFDTLKTIFSKYPYKTYINDSGHGFYALFNPEHFKLIRGLYVDWGEMTEAASPGYQFEKNNYIVNNRPFIYAKDGNKYLNYCELVVPSLDVPPIKFFVPKETITELNDFLIRCN